MSDEITVGHYASHDERAIKHPVTTLSRLQMALFELAKVTTEKQTLQQVVFERDKTILELRAELKSAQDDGAWISVKDRLPDKSGYYAVWAPKFKDSSMACGFCASDALDKFWLEDWLIEAWRELPTPPKEKR